jgi:trehalose-6-phosphate synthase
MRGLVYLGLRHYYGNSNTDKRIGSVEFMPIHFMHKSISFDEMISLYAVSDVCIVSSTRDGMNLVSFEYIATQRKRNGVMILSEFTGAAQSLSGSVLVNPWNTEELANALHNAVTMTDEQRQVNYQRLAAYINKYTSAWWGQSFVKELGGHLGVNDGERTEVRRLSVAKGIEKNLITIRSVSDEESEAGLDDESAHGGAVQQYNITMQNTS